MFALLSSNNRFASWENLKLSMANIERKPANKTTQSITIHTIADIRNQVQ
jgi:hypothetical protein